METKGWEDILDCLDAREYTTADQIAESIGMNEKTVRCRIKEMNPELEKNGASIISKRRKGYCLKIHNRTLYDEYRERYGRGRTGPIPTNPMEREQYLFAYLLSHDSYVKMEELADLLYISRNTLTADLKKVECILDTYGLHISRRPNFGILVEGSEFDKRRCIVNLLGRRDTFVMQSTKNREDRRQIGILLLEFVQDEKLNVTEISFESLVDYLLVAVSRIQHGQEAVPMNDHSDIGENPMIRALAVKLAHRIGQKFHVCFSEWELLYLMIHLGGRMRLVDIPGSQPNIVIPGYIDELVQKMLLAIYEGLRLDLRDDFKLRMSLDEHMHSFDIRMQYHILLKNELLQKIRREYAYPYMAAAFGCAVLADYYKEEIPEDEVGYFAMIIAAALEHKERSVKKNIVIVCFTGKGSSQLFMQRYRQTFGKYVNRIDECSYYQLREYDFTDIDFVLTTIPLAEKIPVPVFEVNLFLDAQDVNNVSRYLKNESIQFLSQYFREDLFFSHINLQKKEEILRYLCNAAANKFDVPAHYYEMVCRREELGQTDFGNLGAIPHSCEMQQKDNFVVVGILERPVWWGHNDVQVVFLINIGKNSDIDTERFYQAITDLLFSQQEMAYLIEHPDYGTLLDLLTGEIASESV